MRAVVQRAAGARVKTENKSAEISTGLAVFLGVMRGDTEKQAEFLAKKIAELRIFSDPDGKMNLSLLDIGGEALVISNFTLATDCKKGRRPSFDRAAPPEEAEALYELFVKDLKEAGVKRVECGEFGAQMEVGVVNDGPVTIILDTQIIGK